MTQDHDQVQHHGQTQQVEFFFDPVCPFCWQTSKWFRQVARLDASVQPIWRFISLALLNDEPASSEEFSASHGVGLGMLRVAAAAKDAHGPEVVGPLYEEMGTRLWEQVPDLAAPLEDDEVWQAVANHQKSVVAALPEIVTAVGLARDLADAQDDSSWDEELAASTHEAMQRTGGDVGTPILSFDPPDGPAFFGPVISSTPTDDEAVELWEAVTTLAQWPSFAEIKRSLREPIDNHLLATLSDQA